MRESSIRIPHTLRRSELFATVDEETLPKIAATATVERYSRGDLIFPEGAECRGIYIVGSGAVKVYKISPDGREHVLHVAEPGDMFGEAAMFLGAGYPAYASAAAASELVLLRRGPFMELLETDRTVSIKLLGAMSIWAHRLVTKLEFITLRDANSRLAGYILERAGKEKAFELGIPKNVLASQLDIASETLSRLFSRFEAQGMIEVTGRKITILDRPSMEDLREAAGD